MQFKLIFTCCALLVAQFLFGQTAENYQPLVCSGNIPKDITTTSTEKYKREIQKIKTKKGSRKKAKTQKRFALESNFALDALLQSGRVVFNDEVSKYLGEVANTLLAARAQPTKQALHVYVLRSYSVNAFATDRGDVFVTLGLLAQLENEAQLAYILAHELTHVEKRHAMSLFLESEVISKNTQNRKVLKRSGVNEKMLAKCAFSKDQENEADRLGLQLLLRTDYRTATLSTVFDVLKYAYLPFDVEPFDRGLLESDDYHLPSDYWLEQVKPIEGAQEDADDDERSHPNLKSRREALLAVLTSASDQGKQDYLVSEERFTRSRDLARLELPLLYLQNQLVPQAIYTSSLLLHLHPDNFYVQKCLLKALYIHAKYSNDGDYDFENDFEKIEGESQQVHYLVSKIKTKEITILALRCGWKLRLAHPDDPEIRAITDDLFTELAGQFEHLDEFLKEAPSSTAAVPDSVAQQTVPEKAAVSKYTKIRQSKTASGKEEAKSPDYWRSAFIPWLSTDAFQQAFAEGKKRHDEQEKRAKYLKSKKGKAETAKAARQAEKKGIGLGIPKVVVVNPFYLKLDARKDNAVQHLPTEEGQAHYLDMIRETAQQANLKAVMLDVDNLKETQTDAFNDIRFLNDWFAQQARQYDLSLTPGHEQERINAIADKYGTDYFLWTGTISLREKNRFVALKIIGSLLLFYPSMPLVAYASLKPKYNMLHYALLYDVRTGRRQVLKFEQFNRRDSDMLVKAHLYDSFVQIRRGKAEKK